MLASAEGFAPAGATKGLSGRPLETFGPHACWYFCKGRNREFLLQCFSLKKHAFFAVRAPAFVRPGYQSVDKVFCSIFFTKSVIHACKRRRFRACGRDQRAFRSPFGNLRPPCLLVFLQGKKPRISSSVFQLEKARLFRSPCPGLCAAGACFVFRGHKLTGQR